MLNHANLPLLQTKPLTMYTINRTPSISYNPTTSKYTINFSGKAIETTVTDRQGGNHERMGTWDPVHVRQQAHGGRPRHRMETPPNQLFEQQICHTPTLHWKQCLILQLFYMDEIPEKLKAFLSDPNFTYVGIEVVFFLISDFIFFLTFIIIIIISHW